MSEVTTGNGAEAAPADDTYEPPCGCMVISASFFFGSLALLLPMAILPLWHSWQARDWRPVDCAVRELRIETTSDIDVGEVYRVETRFVYEVDGVRHTGDRFDFSIGSYGNLKEKSRAMEKHDVPRTTCWVNPEDPEDAVMEPRALIPWWPTLAPVIFLAIGAFGIYVIVLGAVAAARDRRARRREAERWGPGERSGSLGD